MRTLILTVFALLAGVQVQATIDVMVKTSECVVFASDSRITDLSKRQIATDTYEKIVKVCNTVMVQMQGQASIRGRTFKAFVNDFRYHYSIRDTTEITVQSLNTKLADYCRNLREKGVQFGNLLISIAGIDSVGTVRLYGIRPQKDTAVTERYSNSYGDFCFGLTNVVAYLTQGYSKSEISKEKVVEIVRQELTDICQTGPTLDLAFTRISSRVDSLLETMGPVIDFGDFSTKDAIQYAYSLVKITTLIDRLSYGAYGGIKKQFPTTGGDILVAVMTQGGFAWIKAPTLDVP